MAKEREIYGCLCDVRCLEGKDACWNRSIKTSGQKSGTKKRGGDLSRTEKLWILALRHATTCDVAEGAECASGEVCAAAKSVCAHLRSCKDHECVQPYCKTSRRLIAKI